MADLSNKVATLGQVKRLSDVLREDISAVEERVVKLENSEADTEELGKRLETLEKRAENEMIVHKDPSGFYIESN